MAQRRSHRIETHDELFLRFVGVVAVITVGFAICMGLAILFGESDNVVLRMISALGTMFAGILGLGSGYLLGAAASGFTTEEHNAEGDAEGNVDGAP